MQWNGEQSEVAWKGEERRGVKWNEEQSTVEWRGEESEGRRGVE